MKDSLTLCLNKRFGVKLFIRLIVLCFILITQTQFVETVAQSKSKSMRQIERRSKHSDGSLNSSKSRKVIKAEKKAERTKKKQEEAYQKAKKKDLKHRSDMQSDRTKEMMKETKKKAEVNNKRKRTPFFKRLFLDD